jgi:hypothetical protein
MELTYALDITSLPNRLEVLSTVICGVEYLGVFCNNVSIFFHVIYLSNFS